MQFQLKQKYNKTSFLKLNKNFINYNRKKKVNSYPIKKIKISTLKLKVNKFQFKKTNKLKRKFRRNFSK